MEKTLSEFFLSGNFFLLSLVPVVYLSKYGTRATIFHVNIWSTRFRNFKSLKLAHENNFQKKKKSDLFFPLTLFKIWDTWECLFLSMKQDFEISPYVVFKIRIRKRYFQKTLLEKIYTRQFLVTTSGAHFNVWDTFSHQYRKQAISKKFAILCII